MFLDAAFYLKTKSLFVHQYQLNQLGNLSASCNDSTILLFYMYRELDNVLDALKKSADNNWSSPDSLRPNSVINLDENYGLPSPSERNFVVKVRTRSGIKRFNMKGVSNIGQCHHTVCDRGVFN